MKKKILSCALALSMLAAAFSMPGTAAGDTAKARIVNAQSSSFIFPPANAYNGSYDDMFSSGIESNAWIMFEMEDIYECTGVNLVSRGDLWGLPHSFTISYSENGVDWETAPGGVIKDFYEGMAAAQQHNRFDFSSPIYARYIRITTDKSWNDGVNDLTQYAEVEIFGTLSGGGSGPAQEYSLGFAGQTNGSWFQFENMQRESYYLAGAFFIPYYRNPLVGDMTGRRPSILYLEDRWVLVYEGSDGIYCTTSADGQVAGSWEFPYKLIDKGGYDRLDSPALGMIWPTSSQFIGTASVE